MQILKAKTEDIPQVRQLWTQMFDDGTPGFCDFVFSSCKADDIYIVKEDGTATIDKGATVARLTTSINRC